MVLAASPDTITVSGTYCRICESLYNLRGMYTYAFLHSCVPVLHLTLVLSFTFVYELHILHAVFHLGEGWHLPLLGSVPLLGVCLLD